MLLLFINVLAKQIICTILLVSFYLFYFIKMFSLKKQGIKVHKLGSKAGKTKYSITLEIIILIATYLMAANQIVSIILAHEWYYLDFSILLVILGMILLVASNVIFLLAIIAMKDNWKVGISPNEKTTLVTGGIYRFSRNPAFLAFDLSYLGLLFIFGNPLNLVFTIILIILFDLQIKEEEKYLLFEFKETYIEYKQKVRRYF